MALSLGPAALGPGQCQLSPWAPKAFQASKLYKPWLWQRKHQLWPEEQGLKDLCPSPNSSTQARALSCTVSFKDACSPTVAPSIKNNSKPFIGLPDPAPPPMTLCHALSPLFLHSTHIPTSGSSPCCSLCLEHTFPRPPQADLPRFIQVFAQVSATQRGLSCP